MIILIPEKVSNGTHFEVGKWYDEKELLICRHSNYLSKLPQQIPVFPGRRDTLALAKRPLIRRSNLLHPLQDFANCALCDTRNLSNINLSTPSQLQYFTGNMAWYCLNFAKSRLNGRFNPWDSTESNHIRPLSWPSSLTFNKSAHSKLHEMCSQGNSLLKSIQTTSRNWGHMFRNQLQPIQAICQSVELKSLQRIKYFNELAGSVYALMPTSLHSFTTFGLNWTWQLG